MLTADLSYMEAVGSLLGQWGRTELSGELTRHLRVDPSNGDTWRWINSFPVKAWYMAQDYAPPSKELNAHRLGLWRRGNQPPYNPRARSALRHPGRWRNGSDPPSALIVCQENLTAGEAHFGLVC